MINVMLDTPHFVVAEITKPDGYLKCHAVYENVIDAISFAAELEHVDDARNILVLNTDAAGVYKAKNPIEISVDIPPGEWHNHITGSGNPAWAVTTRHIMANNVTKTGGFLVLMGDWEAGKLVPIAAVDTENDAHAVASETTLQDDAVIYVVPYTAYAR